MKIFFIAMNAMKNRKERYEKLLTNIAKCFAPLAVKLLCNYFYYSIRGYIAHNEGLLHTI